MKTYFICYATNRYIYQQLELIEESRQEKFDFIIPLQTDFLIHTGFYEQNKKAMQFQPNSGCIWKPYIILETLNLLQDGDLLVYSDCGDKILPGYLSFIKQHIQKDFFLVQNNFINGQWTKSLCFKLMDCSENKYKESLQLEAGQIGIIKSDFSYKIIKDWLDYSLIEDILLDDKISEEEDKQLIRHSRDQSILTNLQIRNEIPCTSINSVANKIVTYNFRG